jgi:RHS repeat-associated protein
MLITIHALQAKAELPPACSPFYVSGVAGTYNSKCAVELDCYVTHPEGYDQPSGIKTHGSTKAVISKGILDLSCSATCPENQHPHPYQSESVSLDCELEFITPFIIKATAQKEKNTNQCGSIVQTESQSVGESIPIIGASFDLVYFSQYSSGKNYNFHLWLHDIRSPRPENLKEPFNWYVTVTSGEKVFVDDLMIRHEQGLIWDYNWNGRTPDGIPMNGPQLFKTLAVPDYGAFEGGRGVGAEDQFILGSFSAKPLGLGGWLPSNLYFYSPITFQLFGGNGSSRYVRSDGISTDSSGAKYRISNEGQVLYFDENGRHLFTKTSVTGQIVYTFNYDGSGRLSSIVEPFGKSTVFKRDGNGNLTRIISPNGNDAIQVTPGVLNQGSLVTNVNLDSNGYLADIASAGGPGKYEMTYSNSGLLKTFKKPNGQQNIFTYNSDGDLVKDLHQNGYFVQLAKMLVDPIKEPNRYTITSTTSNGLSTVVDVEEKADGAMSSKIRLPSGAEVNQSISDSSETRTVGAASYSRTSIGTGRIDGESFVWQEYLTSDGFSSGGGSNRINDLSDWSDPFSINKITWYASSNGLGSTIIYDGPTKTYTATYSDGYEKKISIDSYERIVSIANGSRPPTLIEYADDKVAKIQNGSRVALFDYNSQTGYLSSITNTMNEKTIYQYNSMGKLSSQVMHDGRSVAYGYDLNGNLASITTPAGIGHAFNWNTNDRPSGYHSPLVSGFNSTTTYQYDSSNRVSKVTRPGNSVLSYSYSQQSGALEKIKISTGEYRISVDKDTGFPTSIRSPQGLENTLTYNGPTIKTNEIRKSDGMTVGTYHRELGGNGSLKSYDRLIDAFGNDSQTAISYSYDQRMHLTQAGSINLTYNSHGQIETTSIGDDEKRITDFYQYNDFGELVSYEVKRGDVSVYSLSLSRDNLGRVLQKTQSMRGSAVTWHYSYDSTGRLVAVSKNGNAYSSYAFDGNNNRISGNNGNQIIASVFDNQDKITSSASALYTYRMDGTLYQRVNTLTGFKNTYTYDSLGYLTKVNNGDAISASYVYDGFGRLTHSMFAGSVDKSWIYQDEYRISGELNGAGQITKRFVYASKTNIPDYMKMGDDYYRIISDNLGSPRLVIRMSDGVVVAWMDHDENGKLIGSSNATVIPFGFAGGFWDGKSGLLRFGVRDYDPDLGRWTSKDPILFEGGDTNLYGYASNDPVNFVDPRGTEITYADEYSKSVLLPMLQKLAGSEKGAQLLAELQNSKTVFVLKAEHPGRIPEEFGSGYVRGNNLYVSLCTQRYINTTNGWVPFDPLRLLAHELGHLTGTKDNGIGQMNNVNKYENPIMQPIDGLQRIEY